MLDVSRFFKTLWPNPRISAEELLQFAGDHIGKLKALIASYSSAPTAHRDTNRVRRSLFRDTQGLRREPTQRTKKTNRVVIIINVIGEDIRHL